MPRGRWSIRTGVAAMLATSVLAGLLSVSGPAAAAEPEAVYAGIVDFYEVPATPADVAGFAEAATAAKGPGTEVCQRDCGEQLDYWCKTLYQTYVIYTFVSTLVRWKTKRVWCYDGLEVVSVKQSEDLNILSNTIRKTGTLVSTTGPLSTRSVRSLIEGYSFQYCPITWPLGVVTCIGEFHPKLDIYLNGNGSFTNQSVLG